MSAIVLPTSPGIVTAQPRLLDLGGMQPAVLGGPTQKIDRLGSRHALEVELPPMDAATALPWIQRLKRGKSSMVRMRVPQPGFTPQAIASAPIVQVSVAGGVSSVELMSWVAAYQFKEGQLWSVVHGGRSYLYSIDADVTAGTGGASDGRSGIVGVTPMTRTALTSGDLIELVTPIIEGFPEGDETRWTVDAAAHYGLSFSIVEAE